MVSNINNSLSQFVLAIIFNSNFQFLAIAANSTISFISCCSTNRYSMHWMLVLDLFRTCPHGTLMSSLYIAVMSCKCHSSSPDTTNSRITRSGSGSRNSIDFSVGTTQQDKDKTKICLSQFARCSPNCGTEHYPGCSG